MKEVWSRIPRRKLRMHCGPGGGRWWRRTQRLYRDELKAQTLTAKLSDVGISADRVVLEITERYPGPLEPVIIAARELQRCSFKLALDDTGAGNAGLEFLSRLKVDFIKIDSAIVANGANEMAARGVISAIVALAKTTNAYVIAEGIEDQTMLDLVRSKFLNGAVNANAVSGVQGYLLGRPGVISAATNGADVTRSLLRARSVRVHVAESKAQHRLREVARRFQLSACKCQRNFHVRNG